MHETLFVRPECVSKIYIFLLTGLFNSLSNFPLRDICFKDFATSTLLGVTMMYSNSMAIYKLFMPPPSQPFTSLSPFTNFRPVPFTSPALKLCIKSDLHPFIPLPDLSPMTTTLGLGLPQFQLCIPPCETQEWYLLHVWTIRWYIMRWILCVSKVYSWIKRLLTRCASTVYYALPGLCNVKAHVTSEREQLGQEKTNKIKSKITLCYLYWR